MITPLIQGSVILLLTQGTVILARSAFKRGGEKPRAFLACCIKSIFILVSSGRTRQTLHFGRNRHHTFPSFTRHTLIWNNNTSHREEQAPDLSIFYPAHTYLKQQHFTLGGIGTRPFHLWPGTHLSETTTLHTGRNRHQTFPSFTRHTLIWNNNTSHWEEQAPDLSIFYPAHTYLKQQHFTLGGIGTRPFHILPGAHLSETTTLHTGRNRNQTFPSFTRHTLSWNNNTSHWEEQTPDLSIFYPARTYLKQQHFTLRGTGTRPFHLLPGTHLSETTTLHTGRNRHQTFPSFTRHTLIWNNNTSDWEEQTPDLSIFYPAHTYLKQQHFTLGGTGTRSFHLLPGAHLSETTTLHTGRNRHQTFPSFTRHTFIWNNNTSHWEEQAPDLSIFYPAHTYLKQQHFTLGGTDTRPFHLLPGTHLSETTTLHTGRNRHQIFPSFTRSTLIWNNNTSHWEE